MKTVRKFLAIIISVIMTLLCFPLLASGAQTVSYSANDIAGKKGETVTVTVKISSTVKVWGSNVSLSYNSSELQFVSCSKGDAISNGSLHNTGSAVNFSGTYKSTTATVFTVKFKIKKDSGTCTLKLTSTENIDYDGKSYSCTTKNGSVTVLNSTTILGDVTGDGKIAATDARMILQYVAGIKTLSNKQIALADVNKDGKIAATDARYVLQMVAGLK